MAIGATEQECGDVSVASGNFGLLVVPEGFDGTGVAVELILG
jgi:hypothetical protein